MKIQPWSDHTYPEQSKPRMAANINNPELLRDDTVIYVNSKGIELAAAAAAQ